MLHAGRECCLEDVAWVVAGGDRLTGEAFVQRLAIADLHFGVAGRERGSLRGAARRGVGVEAAGSEGGGDLAAPLGPLAAQAGWDAVDLPPFVPACPLDAEAVG